MSPPNRIYLSENFYKDTKPTKLFPIVLGKPGGYILFNNVTKSKKFSEWEHSNNHGLVEN